MIFAATDAAGRARSPGSIARAMTASGLVALALSACVSAPRSTDARLPAAYAAPTGATLPDQALDRWWTTFDDPTLTRLVDDALTQGHDARLAAARLDEARAVRRGQVRQLYIPSTPLKVSASRTRTQILDQTGTGSFTQAGDSESDGADFDVSWELDLIGRRRTAMKVVNNDLAGARFAYEGARAALAANVAQSYFQARVLAVQLDDARESARIARALADLAGEKSRRGLSPRSDADRAAADLAQADAQVAGLDAELQVARRSLLILVGRGTDPLADAPALTPLADAPPPPASVPGTLLVRRPDVREAQARLASASANLNVNELALFPTFTMAPGVGLSKSVSPSFFTPGASTSTTSSAWSIGLNLSIPILNIPTLMAQIDAQDARTEQAAILYEKTVQTAFGEAEAALLQLSADQRQVTLLSAGERRAAAAQDASRRGYAAGLIDLSSTLQAEQAWRAARSALSGARGQALLRAVQTYKALGGGWSPQAVSEQTSAR